MATAEGMTNAAERRARIVGHVTASITTRGYPPSAQELAKLEGVHRSQVQVDLAVLVDAGVLEVDSGVVRGIRLAGKRVVLVDA